MNLILLILCIISITSCNDQKRIIFKIDSLKAQEISIFYDKKGYPELQTDSVGNFIVVIDTNKKIFTSTTFSKIKNYRNIFCFKDMNQKCYYEDYELESDGFTINVYSTFISDTTSKENYLTSYDRILIEKIRR